MHSPHLLPLAQDDWPLFMISWGQVAPFSSKLAETLHVLQTRKDKDLFWKGFKKTLFTEK